MARSRLGGSPQMPAPVIRMAPNPSRFTVRSPPTSMVPAAAAVGCAFTRHLLLVTVSAALAYSIAESGPHTFISGLNDFAWAGVVLTSFPRAMLIMSSAFGLWRARLISNALFAVGVAAVVLTLLGGTTWLSGGFWAPDGAYSRFLSPLLLLLWVVVVSRVLLSRAPATRVGW